MRNVAIRSKQRKFIMSALAGLSLAVVSLVAYPVAACAQDAGQDNGGTDQTGTTDQTSVFPNKPITLNLESAPLYYALRLLFAQVNKNYTLDPSLKNVAVTVSLNKVPFRVALETLLRASNLPLTYTFENDVFSIIPKEENVPQEPEPTTNEPPAQENIVPQKIYKGSALVTNAYGIIQILGGRAIPAYILYGMSPNNTGGGFGGGFGGGMGGFGGGMGGFGGGMGGFGGGMGGFGGGMGGIGGGMGGIGGGMGGIGGGFGGGMGGGFGGRGGY